MFTNIKKSNSEKLLLVNTLSVYKQFIIINIKKEQMVYLHIYENVKRYPRLVSAFFMGRHSLKDSFPNGLHWVLR